MGILIKTKKMSKFEENWWKNTVSMNAKMKGNKLRYRGNMLGDKTQFMFAHDRRNIQLH